MGEDDGGREIGRGRPMIRDRGEALGLRENPLPVLGDAHLL